jgi:hypothetical protein
LQARITQDKDKNITIDQRRYALSIFQRYLPNAPAIPSKEDIIKYVSPLPYKFKWTSDDCSSTLEDIKDLEREYGFIMRAVVGSLNYLANTACEELYAIRKACKYMHSPGRPHFKAIVHLLHHLRCHPPKALKYYHNVYQSPLYELLKEAKLDKLDPWFIGTFEQLR